MNDETDYPGWSRESFADAARDAVDRAEKKGLIKGEVELEVTKMTVVASHNPISEYRIVLTPSP